MNAPQAEFIDLYRSGLRNAVDLMKASLENAERVQQEQLSAIRNALDQNARSLEELTRAKSLDELVTLQQKLAGAQFERVMGYWSSFYRSAGQNQAAAIGKQMAQAREWLNESYSLTARAAEEAGKLGAQAPGVPAPPRQQQQPRQERQERPRA